MSAFAGETPEVSVIVPVYNEEENLPILFGEISKALAGTPGGWEVIFIDDGSSDGSLGVIRGLAEQRDEVRYLSFAANRGQSAGFAAGFKAARGSLVVTMDADLQNDPADIPRMLELFRTGYDMVCGWRAKRKDTLSKRVASKIGNRIREWMTGRTVRDTGCSLKVMRTDWARELPVFTGMHRFLPTLMAMRGARITETAVNHRPRAHGVSKYTNWGRALAGSFDLIGVRWMRSRHVEYEIKEQK